MRTRGIGFVFEQDGQPTVDGAPGLGQNTHSILARAGLSEDTIAQLERAGVIRTDAEMAASMPP